MSLVIISMVEAFIYLGIGFTLLYAGGEAVLKGAVGTAQKFQVSPLLIGLTIVSTGTSLPELVVSLNAALGGSSGLTLGNIVGSNIANILLLLGLATVFTTCNIDRKFLKRDGGTLCLVTAIFTGIAYFGSYTWISGVGFLIGLAAYFYYAYITEKDAPEDSFFAEEADVMTVENGKSKLYYILFLIAGVAGVIVGADVFVEGAISIARFWGVSESVIGLTVVAIGTSLPEMATVIPAARKGHTDVIIGNIVGSNILNILAVSGVVSLFVPLPVPANMTAIDLPVTLAATVTLMLIATIYGKLPRITAALFLPAYCFYIYYQFA